MLNINLIVSIPTFKHNLKTYLLHNAVELKYTRLLLLYALFNHPRLLIQVARVQKAQFSYRLDGLVP